MSGFQKIANIALAMFFLGLTMTMLVFLLGECVTRGEAGVIKADCVE